MLGRWRKTSARFWTTLGLVSRRANFDIKVSTAPHSLDVKFSDNLPTIKLITRVMFSSGNKAPDWISQFSDKIESFLAMHNVKDEGERANQSWCGICQFFYMNTLPNSFNITRKKKRVNCQFLYSNSILLQFFLWKPTTILAWIWRKTLNWYFLR